jgi:replicative DNA helicase
MNPIIHRPVDVSRLALTAIDEAIANTGRQIITHTALDTVLTLRKRKLSLVLALSSNWKTGFMKYVCTLNAENISWHGDEAMAYVTLEDSVEDLGISDLANISAIGIGDILDGKANMQAIKAAAAKRGAMPIYVLGHSAESRKARPRLSMPNITAALCELENAMSLKFRLVCIDYLQRIDRDTDERETRMQFMENVERAKDLALILDTHVMLGAQSREDVVTRKNKIPQMGDVHEAPAAGRHAPDAIISLWRPYTTDGDATSVHVKGEEYAITEDLLFAQVTKQKQGRVGDVFPLSVDFARGRVVGAYSTVAL